MPTARLTVGQPTTLTRGLIGDHSCLVRTAQLRYGSTLTLPASDAETPPDTAAEPEEIPPGYSVGHLYFDSVFPLTLGFFDPRGYISALQGTAHLQQLKEVLPEQDKIGFGFRVLGVESRAKDGGAFLTFAYKPEPMAMSRAVGHVRAIPSGTSLTDAEAATLSVINARIRPHLRPIHQYAFSLARLLPESWLPKPSVHIVLGTPWLEDLARYPARMLSIAFVDGSAPTEQQLWEILRPYGRINKLEINAKENKATAYFDRIRAATSARNCLYGASVGSRKILIDYVPPLHAHKIWDWLSSHPRIVLPILAFLLGTFTYAVFDPIRAFFIKTHVDNTFKLTDYRIYAWLKRNTVDLFQADKKNKGSSIDDWFERGAAVDEIQGWLRETPSTFITIGGPRGSGKHPLLQRATDQPGLKHLTIHCEEISHAAKGNEAALVPALAGQVGYFPVFNWISSLNNMIDLAAVGLIGSKAGFSTPTDAQLKQVLNVTTKALVDIKEETLHKKEKAAKRSTKRGAAGGQVDASQAQEPLTEKDASTVVRPYATGKEEDKAPAASTIAMPAAAPTSPADAEKEKTSSSITTFASNISEKANSLLGAQILPTKSQEKTESAAPEESKQLGDELGPEAALLRPTQEPEERNYDAPVVVLDGFHHKGLQSDLLWNVLASWAADLVTSGTAHVVFVTDNPVAMAKTLGRALPNLPFESITLADADEDKARGYVFAKLQELGRIGNAAVGEPQAQLTPAKQAVATDNQSTLSSLFSSNGKLDSSTASPSSPEKAAAAPTGLDAETARWVDLLGGRLTDLESLVKKVELGYTVETGVRDIVARSVVEIRKNAFGDDAEDAKALPWTRGQAWLLVEKLAAKGELPYYSLLHDGFKGDEAALKAMEQAELISVRHIDGRPATIRAGRPVILQALKELCRDRVFADTQRYLTNASGIASCEKAIREVEQEMVQLGECLPTTTANVTKAGHQAIRDRLEHLVQVLGTNQDKLRTLEGKQAELSRSIADERMTGRS